MTLSRRTGSPGSQALAWTHVGSERQIWRAHIDRFPSGKPVAYPVGGSS